MKNLILAALMLSAVGCSKHEETFNAGDVPTLDQAKAAAPGRVGQESVLLCATRDLSNADKFLTVSIGENSGATTLDIGYVTITKASTSRDQLVTKPVVESVEQDATQTFRTIKEDGTPGDVVAVYDPQSEIINVTEPSLLPFTINCATGLIVN